MSGDHIATFGHLVDVAVVAEVGPGVAVHSVDPGDGVLQGPGMALVDGPVHGQHPLGVRGLALQRGHTAGLDHPVQHRAVPEHRVLRQLVSGRQQILPGRKQVRHLERLGVRDVGGRGAEGHHRHLGLGVQGLGLGRSLLLCPDSLHAILSPIQCHY